MHVLDRPRMMSPLPQPCEVLLAPFTDEKTEAQRQCPFSHREWQRQHSSQCLSLKHNSGVSSEHAQAREGEGHKSARGEVCMQPLSGAVLRGRVGASCSSSPRRAHLGPVWPPPSLLSEEKAARSQGQTCLLPPPAPARLLCVSCLGPP